MKKAICLMIFAASAALNVLADAIDDARLTFYTQGTDTYKDGTPVKDGEFYAVVWVAKNATFGGFNADGTLVAKEGNELIKWLPCATGGHLMLVWFSIGANELNTRYTGGEFVLVLLDTRNADGTVEAELKTPTAVNGYQPIDSIALPLEGSTAKVSYNSPVQITSVSTVPADAPQPVITDATLREGTNGREMMLKVKGTAAYLRYTAASVGLGGTADGGTASSPLEEAGATASNGAADPDAEIEIVIPATDKSGFFKVIRKQ